MKMAGWGVTGWENTWTALGSDVPDDDEHAALLTGYGVQRKVDPGVIYAPLAETGAVPRWHPKPQGRGRIFEMVWPEDHQPVTRSLLDIQAVIAARRHKLTAEDRDLVALDSAIDMLLATAESLHAADTSIGFLQPDSCRVGEWRDGGLYVVLPDVGFAWDKQAGLMKPTWITEPALGQLFEQGAERRNEDYLSELTRQQGDADGRRRADDAADRERTDVKILARLVAAALVGIEEIRRWCGDGRCLLNLPDRDRAPDTQAEIWDKVIAPALAGQIATVRELRAGLATYKPSGHYLHEPPPAPWAGWEVLRRTAALTAAAALIGLLWVFSGRIVEWFQGKPAPYCRAVTEDHPLHARLFALEAAREQARGDVSSRPSYWKLLQECLTEHSTLKTCRSECLAELVDEWLLQAEEEGRAVRDLLRSRPRPTPEEVRDISEAVVAIRQAAAGGKRTKPSSVEAVLERELRLRGGVLPEATAEVPNPADGLPAEGGGR
jgi:hypothetical protein